MKSALTPYAVRTIAIAKAKPDKAKDSGTKRKRALGFEWSLVQAHDEISNGEWSEILEADCHQQPNGVDCGVHAILNARSSQTIAVIPAGLGSLPKILVTARI